MKSTEFQPLRDNLLVKPDDSGEEISAGGIVLVQKKAPPAKLGTVVRVGPGLADATGAACASGIIAGDRVAYPTFFGHELKLDDGLFKVLSEREVLGHFGVSPARASLPLEQVKRVTVSIDEDTPAFPTDGDRN